MQNHQKESKKKKVPRRKPEAETFKCDECGQSFTNRRDLKEHVRNQHQFPEDEFASQDATVEALESALTEKNVHDNSSGFRKSMKSNSNRSISLVDESYICECGFSSNSKSGASRHKCHKEKLLIKCTFCEKHCGNAGSLKLHIRAKHKELQEGTANDSEQTTVETRNDSTQNSKSKSKVVNKSASTSVEAVRIRNVEKNSVQEKSSQNPKSVSRTTLEITRITSVETDSNLKEVEAVKRSSRTAKKSNAEDAGKNKDVELVRRSSRRRSIDGHKKKASASRK